MLAMRRAPLPRATALALAGAACLALSAGAARARGATRPAAKQKRAATQEDRRARTRRKLMQQIGKVEFGDIPLGDVLEFLREVAGVNVTVNWHALKGAKVVPTTPVTLSLHNVSARKTLEKALLSAGGEKLGFAVDEEGVIDISTRSALAAAVAGVGAFSTPQQRTHRRLEAKLSVGFTRVTFGDVLAYFRALGGLKISPDWEALGRAKVDAKTRVTLTLVDVSMGKGLEKALAAAGGDAIAWRVDAAGVVRICTKSAPSPATQPAASEACRRTRQRCTQRIARIEFSEIELGDVLEFLRDVTSLNITVNWRALKTVGVDQRTPITLRLSDVSFRKGLDKVLQGAAGDKLTYTVDEEGVIEITTRHPPEK